MKINKIFKKIERFISGKIIKKMEFFNSNLYTRIYCKHLKKYGMQINDFPRYISPLAIFDGNDYSLIHLGKDCVISRDVFLLTHDYSIARGLQAIGKNNKKPFKDELFLKEIYIGNNSFIGARSILLPGTHIGDDCIIGAGAVVKGNVPNNSIVIGNPAKIYAKTTEWAQKKFEEQGFFVED